MLDEDLAELYGVPTKRLNEQVSRNLKRFPDDFMFPLTRDEVDSLRSHFATSNVRRGGRRSLPRAFTEHGILMLNPIAFDVPPPAGGVSGSRGQPTHGDSAKPN